MILIPFLIFVGIMFVLFAILVIAGDMLVNIGGQQVGIMERRFVGRALPESRVVAMRGEVGIQARVLTPGLHFLPPFLFKVTKGNMILVQDDEVGVLESIDGAPLDPGRIFARKVAGHDTYQDGEAFLRAGGQKGPQIDILAPGQYRINTYLFRIKIAPALILPQGNIGLVSARDGEPIQPGRLLARKTDGHLAFQDGEAFIEKGASVDPKSRSCSPAATVSTRSSSPSRCVRPRSLRPIRSAW